MRYGRLGVDRTIDDAAMGRVLNAVDSVHDWRFLIRLHGFGEA